MFEFRFPPQKIEDFRLPPCENCPFPLSASLASFVHTKILTLHKEIKGETRSKISLGYVEVDSLGETLFFTQTKSEKN